MTELRRVLAAQLDPALVETLSPALGRAEFDFNLVPSARSATEPARLIAFDVVLVGCSTVDDEVEALLSAVREPDSASRLSRLLVFAPPSTLPEVERRLAGTADQVLSTALPAIELQEPILRLLRARPRLATRVMARLTVRLVEGSSKLLCQTRDLSRSGMMAITENRYPIGAAVEFVLELPEEPAGIAGEAEVVRHAGPPRDADPGLGLRFRSFRPGQEQRLIDFLARHGA